MSAHGRPGANGLAAASRLAVVGLATLGLTIAAAAQESAPYAETPEELRPFQGAGEPYGTFFQEPPVFRGPGGDVAPPEGLDRVAIGVLVPYEGLDVEPGRRFRQGIELAVAEVNAAGGIGGLPVELLFRDEAKAWGAAANAAVELVSEQGVWGLLGAFDDENTHVLSRVLLKLEVPVVNTSGTDPTLTEHAIPWMIRVRPDDRQNAYRLARRIFEEDGHRRVAVFRANDRVARTGIRELVDAARRLHHPILLEVRWNNPTASDPASLSSQLEKLGALAPDAIVLWGRAEPAAHVLRALRAAGIDAPVYGPDRLVDPAFLRIAESAGEGVVSTVPFDLGTSDPQWTAFQDRYRALWNQEPDATAGYAYDGTRLLLEAMREVGLNRVRIREHLVAARPRRGVTGPIRLDATFNNVAPIRLVQLREGRWVVEDP